jgi:chromosome segregation ATPase
MGVARDDAYASSECEAEAVSLAGDLPGQVDDSNALNPLSAGQSSYEAELRKLHFEAHEALICRDDEVRRFYRHQARLEGKIASLREKLGDKEAEIASLREKMGKKEAEIASLHEKVAQARERIREMKATRLWRFGVRCRGLSARARALLRLPGLAGTP